MRHKAPTLYLEAIPTGECNGEVEIGGDCGSDSEDVCFDYDWKFVGKERER